MKPIITVELRSEADLVLARQRARRIASLLGFDTQDQTRIATAVSEVVRNAIQYARGGRVQFGVDDRVPALNITVSDRGPGIPALQEILEGRYRSRTGMGLGLLGARRLTDHFSIESAPGGTTVTLVKALPRSAVGGLPTRLAELSSRLAEERPSDPITEIREQNRELLRTLDEVRAQKDQLGQVNRELEDTNRGVVALYAELEERADYLRRAGELKTRFLSNMTHEFRTPLNSILSLSRMLLDRIDGDLGLEQERQVRFIERSANSLSELVNDLLDLAKVEAGKITIHPTEFEVSNLFAGLRGMLKPLLADNSAVSLEFEVPEGLPTMLSDESKVSQILRNFISNALKYTERGTVGVSAREGSGGTVVFSVTDTGIGIAGEDLERIFQDYEQIDSPLQRRSQGTGLGLPLTRRLAGLLGGSVGVKSERGEGSTFHAIIPVRFSGATEISVVPEVRRELDPARVPILVVEDNREALFVYEKYFKGTRYQVAPARTLREAREWLRTLRPAAVVLDVMLENESTWEFLADLKRKEGGLPVAVVTLVDNEARATSLGADAFHVKPVSREALLRTLEALTAHRPVERLLIADNDEIARYLLRGMLSDTRFQVMEARDGAECLSRARAERPAAIFLDVQMPDLDGFAVLEALKADKVTCDVPVIIYTSKALRDDERARVSAAAAIVHKTSPTREAALASIRQALLIAGVADPRQ